MIGIYKFTNKINKKVYIGKSINIQRRYREHINLKPGNDVFHAALIKYGIENFNFEVIEECGIEELNEKEKYYICYFNSLIPNGYNVSTGGEHTSHLNKLADYSNITQIKTMLQETNLTNKEIAEKFNVSDQIISDINNGRVWIDETIKYPIRPRKSKDIILCKNCHKKLGCKNKNQLCWECYQLLKSKHIPSKKELKKLIRVKSFSAIGREFNVSDNTIKKWCMKYGLPKHKRDIKQYSNAAWELI